MVFGAGGLVGDVAYLRAGLETYTLQAWRLLVCRSGDLHYKFGGRFARRSGWPGAEFFEECWEAFEAAVLGQPYIVVHAASVVAGDAGVDGNAVGPHLPEGPLPDMKFFQTARSEFTKPDGMMSDFMEKNARADGGSRSRRGNHAFDIPVAVA